MQLFCAMAGVVFILAPTLTGAGTGLLFAYKLHASGESPLYRLVGELGMPWWVGRPADSCRCHLRCGHARDTLGPNALSEWRLP